MARRAVTILGVVQGVGFRPFVYGLASRLALGGFVRNQSGSVFIEVEGENASLNRFLEELGSRPPPLARIQSIDWCEQPPRGDTAFRIDSSERGESQEVFVAADMAVCADCIDELFNPKDRRYRYPFLNCTNCGPRLTIIQGAPYDRDQTTMRTFQMCPQCLAEYADPLNRRFHAQPTACPDCGPQLELGDENGRPAESHDPLRGFADLLLSGQIGALKGLGGFHLVCDARNESAVCALRGRKNRDEKPLAVMVPDAAAAARLCFVSPEEETLLRSQQSPVVLLRRRSEASSGSGIREVCASVAPANPFLGILLPYTPLHHLLMDVVDGIPLVMTSGNRSDEPIAVSNAEAAERLAGIADVFLCHDRPIHVRCDDSVTRVIDGVESPVRRSRGHAPQPIHLPVTASSPILAVGGQLKATFALGRERQAFLSHHLGDLDHFEAYRAFERDISLYEQLFDIAPELIVHDLHPDYASTQYAQQRAKEDGLPLVAVQHHHAHIASCMAEHGLAESVIGVAFDGTGFGIDEATGQPTVWGGEFLVGDYGRWHRAAHLRDVGIPGADRAIREPWRMAVSHLVDADCDLSAITARVGQPSVNIVKAMLERRLNTPLTSSAGRLFDAIASIAGVRDRVSYEGQAAMQLEWCATDTAPDMCYPFRIDEVSYEAKTVAQRPQPAGWIPSVQIDVVDTRPIIRAIADDAVNGMGACRIARRFHSTLVELIAGVCQRLRDRYLIDAVVLSGGVFMNALLTSEVMARLVQTGFRVYRHQLVPPNDGGLSLGQVAVAAAMQHSGRSHGALGGRANLQDRAVGSPPTRHAIAPEGLTNVPRHSRSGC